MSENRLPSEQELGALLGDRLETGEDVRRHHGEGEGWFGEAMPPLAVAFPETNEEVSEIARICARQPRPTQSIAPISLRSPLFLIF